MADPNTLTLWICLEDKPCAEQFRVTTTDINLATANLDDLAQLLLQRGSLKNVIDSDAPSQSVIYSHIERLPNLVQGVLKKFIQRGRIQASEVQFFHTDHIQHLRRGTTLLSLTTTQEPVVSDVEPLIVRYPVSDNTGN